MAKYGSKRIAYGCQQPVHSLVLAHLQVAVYGGYHKIEGAEHIAVIIQTAIIQYISLYALEYFEGSQLSIECIYFLVLRSYTLRREAIGIKSSLRVVAD